MKKIFYFTVWMALLMLTKGCYTDKGNYEYAVMGDVTIDVTSAMYSYSAILGEHLNIPMTVTTAKVSESSLEYTWEIASSNTFIEISDQKAKDFDRILGPDDYFPGNATFHIRLKVSWQENRGTIRAYSPLIAVTISGRRGLMVLHGNDTESDVGIISNTIFAIAAATDIGNDVIFDIYSRANNGAKIPGRGVSIIQHNGNASNATNSWIYMITQEMGSPRQSCVFASLVNFTKQGDYDDLFMTSAFGNKYHKGDPWAFQFGATNRALIDGGDFFFTNTSLYPKLGAPYTFALLPDPPGYRFSRHSYLLVNTLGMSHCFDEIRRGFVSIDPTRAPPAVITYTSTTGPFVPNDMQADLLFFDQGGSLGAATASTNCFLGVFRDDFQNLFIAELIFSDSPPGGSQAQFRYEVSGLPNFAAAKFYALGSANTMCYYATSEGVYQFAAMGLGGLISGGRLKMEGTGVEVPLSGEITMMKIIRNRSTTGGVYQFHNRMMIVGTYENGVGTLHAIQLNQVSGNVVNHWQFPGFGRIYDANLKWL